MTQLLYATLGTNQPGKCWINLSGRQALMCHLWRYFILPFSSNLLENVQYLWKSVQIVCKWILTVMSVQQCCIYFYLMCALFYCVLGVLHKFVILYNDNEDLLQHIYHIFWDLSQFSSSNNITSSAVLASLPYQLTECACRCDCCSTKASFCYLLFCSAATVNLHLYLTFKRCRITGTI